LALILDFGFLTRAISNAPFTLKTENHPQT
jgi:hypothetical protein